jgi:DNA-binding MurR/RpiR family transcriptional regulator
MIDLDLSTLNPLEEKIHEKMVAQSKSTTTIRINEAARLCGCSVSKISKFAKKLGFVNYRQYLDFLYGRLVGSKGASGELKRIQFFVENFDTAMVDELLDLIDSYPKIVVFGYGPSMLCAQYFEYRFRNCSDKMVIAVNDEVTIANIVNESTLLILLTATGKFRSFQDIYNLSKKKGCEVAMIVEEYNTKLLSQCDKIFWLSSKKQPGHLKPYEKSRTIFFIFLEEIIQVILKRRDVAVP